MGLTEMLAALVALMGALAAGLFKWASVERERHKKTMQKAENLEQHIAHRHKLDAAAANVQKRTAQRVKELRENADANYPFDKPRT